MCSQLSLSLNVIFQKNRIVTIGLGRGRVRPFRETNQQFAIHLAYRSAGADTLHII